MSKRPRTIGMLVSLAAGIGLVPEPHALAQTQPQTRRAAPSAGSPHEPGPAAAPAPAPAPADPNQQAAAPAPDPDAQRKMNTILAEWERRSRAIHTLDAQFERLDKSPNWGDERFAGRALLQSPNLACLDQKKFDPQTREWTPEERIVCTGQEVYQYLYSTKQIVVHQLSPDERQRALEEGPLPFLFDMKAEQVQQRYSLSLAQENETSYWIWVLPRVEIDRDSFSKALIELDKESFLPRQLRLLAPNGTDTQHYKFTKVIPNAPVNPDYFRGGPLQGWSVVDPGLDADPAAAEARPAPAPGPAPGGVATERRPTPAEPAPREPEQQPRRGLFGGGRFGGRDR